jgi:hypothetical protein
VGQLQRVPKSIISFGGRKIDEVYQGTIQFKWEDDEGKIHTRRIPGSYYVPQGNTRLFSCQHFCEIVDQNNGNNDPAVKPICKTTSSHIDLRWNNRRNTKTIALDPGSNVGNIHTAPGYQQFHAYSAEFFAEMENDNLLVYASQVTQHGNQDEDSNDDLPVNNNTPMEWEASDTPHEFNLNGPSPHLLPPSNVNDVEEQQSSTAAAEFLRFHQHFGHILMSKIRAMSQKGILPLYIHKQVKDNPVYTACFYAKMKRRPWRSKIPKLKPDKMPNAPGDVVSVAQLISTTPGLIAQLTIPMTKQRYTAATMYVDQLSGLGYVHIRKGTAADKTLESKTAFERFAEGHGWQLVRKSPSSSIL